MHLIRKQAAVPTFLIKCFFYWLFLGMAACVPLFDASCEAKDAGKPPTLLERPPVSSQQRNETSASRLGAPKETGDVKSSEGAVIANSLTSVVKLALDTNNETIKRIEAFYSGAIQQFSTNMQIFLGLFASIATLAGFFGFVTLRNIADETARRQAENALAPLLESNQVMRAEYEKLKGQHNSILEELEQARKSYSSIQEALGNLHQGAAANLHGLRSSILAWLNMIQYMQADDKLDFADRLEDAGQLIKEVLSEIKPDDKKVLSLTYSVYGLVLYYDNKFEEGLEALKKAVSEDSKNYRAAYNYACCACKLANDLDGKGESHRERTTALDEDALTSLELVLNLAPYKKTKVMHEQDFARLHRHERFASLTSR